MHSVHTSNPTLETILSYGVSNHQGPHVSPTTLRDVKRSTGFNPFSFNLFGNSSRRSIQPPSNMPAGPPPGHATVGSFSLRPDYGLHLLSTFLC